MERRNAYGGRVELKIIVIGGSMRQLNDDVEARNNLATEPLDWFSQLSLDWKSKSMALRARRWAQLNNKIKIAKVATNNKSKGGAI